MAVPPPRDCHGSKTPCVSQRLTAELRLANAIIPPGLLLLRFYSSVINPCTIALIWGAPLPCWLDGGAYPTNISTSATAHRYQIKNNTAPRNMPRGPPPPDFG